MSISDEEIRQAISETFRIESDEHIQTVNRLLLRLEQGDVDDTNACLDEIAREAHTLKGASSILGLTMIQDTSHAMEEVFEALRDAQRETPPELFDLLYDALDRLAMGCQRVQDPEGSDAEALLRVQKACHKYALEAGGVALDREADSADTQDQSGTDLAESTEIGTESTVPVPVGAPLVETQHLESAAPVPSTVDDGRTRTETTSRSELGPEHRLAEADVRRAPDGAQAVEETIRVPIRKLDSLMAQIGELLIAKIRNDERQAVIRDLQREIEEANQDWNSFKDVRRRLESLADGSPERQRRALLAKRNDLLDRTESHLKSISYRASTLNQDFARDAMHMSILAENLQEDIKKARMLPVATILDGFHLLVRDVARREGKRAVLHLEGTETEVDKRVLELIKDPLMHLLRNAVSHGIEPPELREQAGKPPLGSVEVTTRQVGGQIEIEVRDDGQGIDLDRVVEKAVRIGLLESSQVRSVSEKDSLQFLFHSGFSTRDEISDISGRGVGLDVVRENLQKVQGQIAIQSTVGIGTTMTITLPLTLSTTKSLLVEASGQVFALPIHSVDRIVRITPSDIRTIEDSPVLMIGGVPIALARLSEILGLEPVEYSELDPKLPVVLMTISDRRLGLIVDSLVDEQEMVVKPLGKQLRRIRNISGGTIVGSGAVILVLDPNDLLRNASADQRGRLRDLILANDLSRAALKQRIVIAEDSITTRTLEKNILEMAGYEVVACKDGDEALEYLSTHGCDALIADIMMPNLDGFSLIEQVRKIDAHRDLPIILVTSVATDENRRRGMELGANGYIVKTEFEQGRFLDLLKTLL